MLAQDGGQEMFVLRAPATIDLVIGSHHAPGIAIADGHLKGTEVDFVHGPVGDAHIDEASVVFLVVEGIVLQAYGRTVVLRTFGICHSQHTAEIGVFTEVFIGSSTRWETLDIDGWPQYHILATQPGLMAHALSVGKGPLDAPGGCQCRTRREEGGRVGGQMEGVPGVRLHLLTDTERSVRIFYICNVQTGDTLRGEHVLAMQHGDLLFETHVLDNGINL